jgi:hypothetical protein
MNETGVQVLKRKQKLPTWTDKWRVEREEKARDERGRGDGDSEFSSSPPLCPALSVGSSSSSSSPESSSSSSSPESSSSSS